VIPQVEVKEYAGLQVEAEHREQTGDPFDSQLTRLRDMFAQHHVVEGGEIGSESAALLNFNIRDERGKAARNLPQGSRFIARLASLPKEVVDALMGKKAGDSVSVEVSRERAGAHATSTPPKTAMMWKSWRSIAGIAPKSQTSGFASI
jgi:FKBP-type peptidyl-prolyl cis-trans isomerase (trigger factor)